jgi:hypothetical protein
MLFIVSMVNIREPGNTLLLINLVERYYTQSTLTLFERVIALNDISK